MAEQSKLVVPRIAVDHIAAAAGALVLVLGVVQLVAPGWAAPFTAVEAGTGSAILGLLWAVLGGLLTISGIIRTRVVTIFAAEVVLLFALAALTVVAFTRPNLVPLLIHGTMAVIGLVGSGFTRLADKADLQRELRLMRERASLGRETVDTVPDSKFDRTNAPPDNEIRKT